MPEHGGPVPFRKKAMAGGRGYPDVGRERREECRGVLDARPGGPGGEDGKPRHGGRPKREGPLAGRGEAVSLHGEPVVSRAEGEPFALDCGGLGRGKRERLVRPDPGKDMGGGKLRIES